MTTELALAPNNAAPINSAEEPAAPRSISRQRRWQLKMREEHRCWRCGEPALGSLCATHLVQERERQRRINGYSTRNLNALSYIFGGAAPARAGITAYHRIHVAASMKPKPDNYQPDSATVDALSRLVCAYVDLKMPTPEELVFMLPDDGEGHLAKQNAAGKSRPPTNRFVVPTCFSPLYSAETPTASMRKLGPVAWHAVEQGLAEVEVPEPIDPDKLRRLHAPEYVDAFLEGKQPLASAQGWSWTPQIRDGVLAMHGGQLLGTRLALEHGIAANIAQGFHHAGYARGGGYCTFNGLTLVAQEFPNLRVFVLDCDEHGGNGTEEFTQRLPNLYNFSINGTALGCAAASAASAARCAA